MRTTLIIFLAALFIFSCSEHKPVSLPAKPGSPGTVKNAIQGKLYKTIKAGTLSPFEMDKKNPYEWTDDMKDTSSMFRNFFADRMKFILHFINDTAVNFMDEGKHIEATYSIDSLIKEDEKPGVKLRISYEDKDNSFNMGDMGPVRLTYTYIVAGADDKQLLLETPRSYNDRKVIVLMSSE